MASRHMSLCCSRELSGSMLPSVLQSELNPLLSPFIRTTSQWLLDASVPQDDSVVIGSPDPGSSNATAADPAAALPSASACSAPSLGSASGLAAPSRFSLLLERRCLLPSWGRRSRPGLRPPPVVLGLPEGLLVRLREDVDFLLGAGDADGGNQRVNSSFTTESS